MTTHQFPAAADKTFYRAALAANVTWKATTSTLSDEARQPGDHGPHRHLPVCLPGDNAELNLLPEARQIALERFTAADIPWHQGIGDGPSGHLLSSQVQCANALAPFVEDPGALAEVFAGVLPIAEMIPFGADAGSGASVSPFDATDHVVFEWQGLANHLGEWTGPPRRGAMATSADAALRYRTPTGSIEVALIEWKYTERYPDGHLSGGPVQLETRLGRYQHLVDAPDGPIDTDVAATVDLFGEPVYQLLRQALLADRIEASHELDADRVRVVLAAPAANASLWASLGTEAFAQLAHEHGGGLTGTWKSLLRRPDRFCVLDTATLVADTSPCSAEFKTRYGHLAHD
jgi:hypothetical protein